jgi:hypothetical protein
MTVDELEAAEMELRRWHASAEPTAQNFRRYADRLEAIVAERQKIKKLTKPQAAAYFTTVSAYRANADALDNLKNHSVW